MRRLVLLNGLPGVGKSTLARRLGAEGWYVVDPDRLRVSGADAATARDQAWAQVAVALEAGRDVAVAQLVARPEELARLARVATSTGARFLPVVLSDPTGVLTEAAARDDDQVRSALRGPAGATVLAGYRDGLATVAARRGVHELTVTPGDPDATYAALVALLA